MKIIYTLILLYCSNCVLIAQKINPNFINKVDTLYIIDFIGNVSEVNGYDLVESKELAESFQEAYCRYFLNAAAVKTSFIQDSTVNDSTRKNMVRTITRVSKLEDTLFNSISCGSAIADRIKNKNGRFFGIICYSGVYNKSYTEELIAGSLMAGVAGSALGSNLFLTPILKSPHFISYLLVVDKETNKLVYCNVVKTMHNLTKETYIQKHTVKMWKPFSQSININQEN